MKQMTVKELTSKVLKKEHVFIFDVRNESDFKDWKIEGENFAYLNVPYFELIDGIEAVVDRIPKDQEVIVVCAKGGSSEFVAEQLEEAGFQNVFTLVDGMQAWSEHLHKAMVYEDENMKVYQFIRVGKGCLSYMVISGKEALVVDPSRFIDVYEDVAREEGVNITHIVDSHLHADHISGGRELAERTGAKYYLMKSEGAVYHFEPLEMHDTIDFEQVQLEVLAVKTPGHTPGSVSFFVNHKLLFSGDTIFVGGLGRPDLGGKAAEWALDLYDTVYEKVAAIADDVVVLPGHYASLDDEMNGAGFVGDTLGNIRARNEMMQNQSKEEFVEMVVQNANNETPPNFEEIVAINRGLKEADAEQQQELEIGPNRCALHHTH
ncbi:rhodanese-like domain protein [Anoxybacillus sp. B7M1]|jgi:glyoxylase-like metal-dependent hydrolase (beta-lactamase superfamily II)/rhodanese-related sulfurtransferase|uniref:MBL fold metallo-hydrolase n=1 Tax=unclassified Anoxybacillus TaxID=2639704 RepID=UPI0007B58CEF|nr:MULTISPECIES: MBL fold metallo-hydrolase [unclassified Anoxybacillus]ANB57811.1 rhodanese-like domain protein [Anoxybacillus sp. B2M1]ANB65675.1 rhodanese-like domain protein [Anoxybacillus sp. B7M1]